VDRGSQVTVRVFGVLREIQRERGHDAEEVVVVPAAGCSAHDLAVRMELPTEMIEGAFCNHTIFGLEHPVRAGDEVAFVPYGTPGPHRYFLGLYRAGREGR
jgi:molybdopterin converting factor small subunit